MRQLNRTSAGRTLAGITLAIAALLFSLIVSRSEAADPALGQIARDAYAAYAKSDWKTAITGYRTLVDRGVADPVLYCNLGTAYAQADDRGRAVWMLLRAARYDARDRDIRENLHLLAPELSSQLAVFPVPPLEFTLRRLTLNEWASVAGVFTVLAGICVALFFYVKRGSRHRLLLKRLAIVAVAFAVFCHAFAWVKYSDEVLITRAVVVARGAQPLSAPHSDATRLNFDLPPGSVVTVEPSGAKDWIKAVYGGRIEFFIHRQQVELLRA